VSEKAFCSGTTIIAFTQDLRQGNNEDVRTVVVLHTSTQDSLKLPSKRGQCKKNGKKKKIREVALSFT
jgi:hypothetical protein